MVRKSEHQLYDIGAAIISITPQHEVDLYTLDGVERKSDFVHSELQASAVTMCVYSSKMKFILKDNYEYFFERMFY